MYFILTKLVIYCILGLYSSTNRLLLLDKNNHIVACGSTRGPQMWPNYFIRFASPGNKGAGKPILTEFHAEYCYSYFLSYFPRSIIFN